MKPQPRVVDRCGRRVVDWAGGSLTRTLIGGFAVLSPGQGK